MPFIHSMRMSLMAPNPINKFDPNSAAKIIAKEGLDGKPFNLLVGKLQREVRIQQIPDDLLEGFDVDVDPDFDLSEVPEPEPEPEDDLDDDDVSGFAAL